MKGLQRPRVAVARIARALMLASLPLWHATASEAQPAYVSDFEDSVIDWDLWGVSGNSPTVVNSPTRSGRYALKSVLDRAKSNTPNRTEIASGGRMNRLAGNEYWYGFSVYLPSDYVADPIWEIVAQWHSAPDNSKEADQGLNPPISLHTEDGIWMVSTIWDSKPVSLRGKYDGGREYELGAYDKGRWTDWVFHVKWSPNQSGLLQVWKDGDLIIDKAGPIGYNDQTDPFMKVGMYKGWASRKDPPGNVSTRTIYHDEIRVAGAGARYADVAPGKGSGGGLRPEAPADLRVQN